MKSLTTRVRDGRIVLDDPTDLPEGTEVEILLPEASDDMTTAELVELDAALSAGAGEIERGEVVDAREVIAKLQARR